MTSSTDLKVSEKFPSGNTSPPLIDEIIGIFPNKGIVTIETEMADFPLSERVVSPLGIIVNELTTNAMKYAFTGRDRGMISVSASLDNNRATRVFEDNGNGIPESVDSEKSSGFGLQLITLLTEQLQGTIRLERQAGAKFIIEFEIYFTWPYMRLLS
jgi:two-component sensor histidine kinase